MRAEAWPAADKLFRSDPLWMGSDDAYSVPLGGDRTLWLFGDTFIANEPGRSRRQCHFISNSIGIQTGSDPSTAEISFHWATGSSGPASFFELPDDEWLWPLDGTLADDVLILFFMRVRPTSKSGGSRIDQWREMGSLGFFDVHAFYALRVLNPQDSPDLWQMDPMESVAATNGIIAGAALLTDDEHLLAYGWRDREGFLCRWDAAKAAQGHLDPCEWWDGGSWSLDPSDAKSVLDRCTTEFTIHPHGEQLVHVQMGDGIQVRRSSQPQGPFTEPRSIYSPPENARGVFTYAAKAHPQLTGADFVCTYASIAEVDETLDDTSIYFPRFVRVHDIVKEST